VSGEMYEGLQLWAGVLCSLVGALGVVYLALATILILGFRLEPRARTVAGRAASILVPLCGEDGRLRQRLSAFCKQDYTAPVEVICGVHDYRDPAVDIVISLANEVGSKIHLKIDPREHGGNRKVSNLINMAGLARSDLIVIIDSDIEVGPGHLSEIVAEFENPGVGAATCLYHGVSGEGLWSDLSALSINAHFLPSVVLALAFGIARPCFGSTIALPRSVLKRIGGLRAFADCLHDDYALGQRVREVGLKVAVARFTVGHFCQERSLAALMLNQIRTARTIKLIDPVGYAGSIVAHPTAFAVAAALLGGPYALSLLLLSLAGRLGVCLAVERTFSIPRQSYWLLPFYDLLFIIVYVASYFGAHVTWRGERFRLNADGSLVHDVK
jgi:ceramide glucosyltransferase